MPWTVASVSSPPQFSPSAVLQKSTETQPSPEMFAVWTRVNENHEDSGRQSTRQGQVMKNKRRPPNLVLPPPSQEKPPKTTSWDLVGDMESETEGYAVFCKKGRRRSTMEDRYAAVLGTQGDPKQAFFGVFDGHGGPKAADFVANNLQKNVAKEMSQTNNTDIKEALKKAYLTTDDQFLKQDVHGGTCCVTAVMHRGHLVVSNAGDCRAVMSRGGVAEALTVDHKASSQHEQERIMRQGGYVFESNEGAYRVEGILAVSRSIGDGYLKRYVIAEPETNVLKIGSDCEFLIMASDGLWDTVSNQEAVDEVRSLYVGVERPEALSACKKLVDLSVARGSGDDISVMIIDLSGFIK